MQSFSALGRTKTSIGEQNATQRSTNVVGLKKFKSAFKMVMQASLFLLAVLVINGCGSASSHIYVNNGTSKEGKVEVGGETHTIAAGAWEKIAVSADGESYPIKAMVGDSVVFDTTMGPGSWIGNLGGDKVVIAEEVEYSSMSFGNGSDDLAYEMLLSPGIARFSTSVISDLYDFDKAAPEKLSVSSGSGGVRKFDLQLMSQAEMFKMMMEAMGDEEYEDEGDEEVEGDGAEEEVEGEENVDRGEEE